MVTAYARGNSIYFKNNEWFYVEDNSKFDDSKPCKKCGKHPMKEGYDACLGYVKDAKSACCGHGVEEPYIKY